MLISRDVYTNVEYVNISTGGTSVGQAITQYEVRAYTDVRNGQQARAFVVTCTQRLIVPNLAPYDPHPAPIAGFLNYPALLTSKMEVLDTPDVFDRITLLDYSPRTLNTSVSTSRSTGESSDVSLSQQHSTGSSTAQTNSYGLSASLGFFGDLPTGELSGQFEHSSTSERSSSSGTSRTTDQGRQLSNSSSMTIKDWGSYSSIDPKDQSSPTWVWGQEFPWNVVQLKNADSSGHIVLPKAVCERLYDKKQVYPPSELSLFGVDFVAKASWLVTPRAGQADSAQISFGHSVYYGAASHSVQNDALQATLSVSGPIQHTSQPVDLAVLGLDPIRSTDESAAIVGFVPNQFEVPPAAGAAFAITAESNDLLVRGQGFTGIMATDFTAGPVQMKLYFKIVESTPDVTLMLKHWVQDPAAGCTLTLRVNGETGSTITRHVNVAEAGSGGANLMSIALRKKDFTSVDYCDYLRMGLNTVEITFTPTESGSKPVYQILALAVE